MSWRHHGALRATPKAYDFVAGTLLVLPDKDLSLKKPERFSIGQRLRILSRETKNSVDTAIERQFLHYRAPTLCEIYRCVLHARWLRAKPTGQGGNPEGGRLRFNIAAVDREGRRPIWGKRSNCCTRSVQAPAAEILIYLFL